jgi:hydrogenase nickel incorporation protein HypB
MCGTDGTDHHHVARREPVEVHESILSDNDRQAAHNREHFREAGVLAVNIMGSPGSGKTALLEATASALQGRRRLGALAGDLATDHDASRLRVAGIRAASITTGSACHLDAGMVHSALHHLAWTDREYLFIENVGNLVCPAVYDLGQDVNVVALSVTEGEDKPLKYPVIFRKADLVLLTKIDLLPVLPQVQVEKIEENLSLVMPKPAMIPVSATTGDGIALWLRWLNGIRAPRAAACAVGAVSW